MKSIQVNKNKASKYIWGGTCESFVLLNTPGLSVKQELMPPGTKEQLHFHERSQQFLYILKGEATFYVEDEILTLNEQEGVHIKALQKHFVSNETHQDLEFLVISQPDTTNDRINV